MPTVIVDCYPLIEIVDCYPLIETVAQPIPRPVPASTTPTEPAPARARHCIPTHPPLPARTVPCTSPNQ